MARRPVQMELPRARSWGGRGWGGKRAGAGRKRVASRPRVPHRPRPTHHASHPEHLTWRCRPGLGSLRGAEVFPAICAALAAQRRAAVAFRVVHFSVQDDHLHLLVEARDSAALRTGAQALAVRLARAVNRALGRRGRVFDDRFHARALRTPREVRFALAYVLHNFKKHQRPAARLDPCSSAAWFDGFREDVGRGGVDGAAPVHAPRTWLARVGWRRHGLVSLHERPHTV